MSEATRRVEFLLGDIATSDCEAIVNPCSSGFLQGHAGVNGALAAAAGPGYRAECAELTGQIGSEMLVTGGGELTARIVIHAVSPIWNGGERGELEALRRLHERLLEVTADHGCISLALPAIGTGAHRFPAELAGAVAVPTIEQTLPRRPPLERVCFVFVRRATLHDYLVHSSNTHAGTNFAREALRAEIAAAVRAAGDPTLAATIAELDEHELRSIQAAAHHLARSAAQGDSLSINTLYTLAAKRTVTAQPGPEPGGND